MTNPPPNIAILFPTPVFVAKSNSDLTSKEEIEKIIQQGMKKNTSNSTSINSYIFNENLKELKQFCEQQIKIYVEQIINPKEELDFYITQSWLNITKPDEFHHEHLHTNSIISGVFYIATVEDDKIIFADPNIGMKNQIKFEIGENNVWNSTFWYFPVNNNKLVLFPSWLCHRVDPNEKATTDRISLSFNTFVKGALGKNDDLNELILK